MKTLLLFGLMVLLGCATGPRPEQPIDWQLADEQWSVHIVTVDPDGDERVTRIWIAAVGDAGAIRTGDSQWWQNLQRDARCRLRIDGRDTPVVARFVSEPAEKVRIDEAFSEKYGWMERVMFPQERGESHENFAWLHRHGAD